MVVYDKFGVEGICSCGDTTYWYIDGDFPLCKSCAGNLIFELKDILEGFDS